MENRPAKRVRQACEPCRRKKAKCSGEQPTCATCNRLQQTCAYRAEAPMPIQGHQDARTSPYSPNSALHAPAQDDTAEPLDRIQTIEATLKSVVQTLEGYRGNASSYQLDPARPSSSHGPANAYHTPGVSSSATGLDHRISRRLEMQSIAETYLSCCECQPLPLFEPTSFVQSFPNREPEVIYSVVAIVSRFGPASQFADENFFDHTVNAGKAYNLTMQRVVDGTVELSTLQALCLLVLYYFDVGQIGRSQLLSSTAMTLAQAAQLDREPQLPIIESIKEERRRGLWAVALLHRLLGDPEQLLQLHKIPTVPFPKSPYAPPPEARKNVDHSTTAMPQTPASTGVMSFVIELSQIWPTAMDYLRSCRSTPDRNVYPWSPESQYTKINGALMDLGHKVPLINRYRSIDVSKVDHNLLEASKLYWCPWLMARIVYHALICLANHPLLLTLQVRHARNVSDAFLYRTASMISNHVSWVMHYLEFMRTRDFFVTDLLTVYCVGVVATIELQRSFFKDDKTRDKAKLNLQECLGFISTMKGKWLYADRMATKLEAIQADMSIQLPSDLDHGNSDGITVNVSGIFEILDFPQSLMSYDVLEQQGSVLGRGLQHGIAKSEGAHSDLVSLPRLTPIGRGELHNPSAPPILGRGYDQQAANDMTYSSEGAGLMSLDDTVNVSVNQFFYDLFQDPNAGFQGL